jgi:HAD superfamily hydrolase (TIGR01509 family)
MGTSTIKAILFDNDGVLVDTERLFFEATREAFSADGVLISPDQWATWYLAEGRRSREIGILLGIPQLQIEATIENRDRLFWDNVEAGVPVLPGVREALRHLSKGYRLAVVTGASRSHFARVHSYTGLTGFFELVVARDDYDEPKPSPECYLMALQTLGVAPQECLVVEDSPRGAAAAVQAGARCAVIPTPLTKLDLCPAGCEILRNMTELSSLTKWKACHESIASSFRKQPEMGAPDIPERPPIFRQTGPAAEP